MLEIGKDIFFVLLRPFDHLGKRGLGSNNIAKMESCQKAHQQEVATTTDHDEKLMKTKMKIMSSAESKLSTRLEKVP